MRYYSDSSPVCEMHLCWIKLHIRISNCGMLWPPSTNPVKGWSWVIPTAYTNCTITAFCASHRQMCPSSMERLKGMFNFSPHKSTLTHLTLTKSHVDFWGDWVAIFSCLVGFSLLSSGFTHYSKTCTDPPKYSHYKPNSGCRHGWRMGRQKIDPWGQ